MAGMPSFAASCSSMMAHTGGLDDGLNIISLLRHSVVVGFCGGVDDFSNS